MVPRVVCSWTPTLADIHAWGFGPGDGGAGPGGAASGGAGARWWALLTWVERDIGADLRPVDSLHCGWVPAATLTPSRYATDRTYLTLPRLTLPPDPGSWPGLRPRFRPLAFHGRLAGPRKDRTARTARSGRSGRTPHPDGTSGPGDARLVPDRKDS